MPWVYLLFGVAEVGIKFLSSVHYVHFFAKPSVVPGNGPGTSNDTKNFVS